MEAVAIAGLVALVWGGAVFLRGGLLGGCLAVLLAGCCFGFPWFRLPTEPVPLTVDRVLWVALLIQYVVWRRWDLAEPKPLGKSDAVLFALFGLLLVSTFTHDWQANGAQPVARLVFYWIMPLGMYWVARQAALGERSVLTMFACLAAFGVYLAVTALAETHQVRWMIWPGYIASAEYPEFLGRGRGPLLNPIGCGLFQAVCLCGAWMWWPRLGRAGQLLLLGVSVLIGLGIYWTLTRSVWIGAAAGLLIVIGLSLPRNGRLPVLGLIAIAGAMLAASQWNSIVALKRDRELSAHAAAKSIELRPILAAVAWKMFLDRPLLGCGFGQYPEEHGNYLSDRSTELVLEKARPYGQHNTFLALLTETGILGAGLFALLLALWTCDAWRLWRRQTAPLWTRQQGLLFLVLAANYAINAMFHDLAIIPMVHMLFFFVAGVTAGLCRSAPRV